MLERCEMAPLIVYLENYTARSMPPKLLRYVTPQQKHSGKAAEILTARAERKRLARLHRLKTNRQQVSQPWLAKAA